MAQMQDLLKLATASSTQSTYSTGVEKFLKFCRQHGVQPLSADKETIVFFAVALSRSLALSSIQVYLAAVNNLHRQLGFKPPTCNNPRVHMVLQGVKRAQARTMHCQQDSPSLGKSSGIPWLKSKRQSLSNNLTDTC